MPEVTDPALLKQLNAPAPGEVTDPAVLKQLNTGGAEQKPFSLQDEAAKARTSLGTGFMDPLVGSAQLLAHGAAALPAAGAIHQLGKLASGPLDEYAQSREDYFKQEGGYEGQRFFGNLLNPGTWFGGGEAVAGTKAAVWLERTAEAAGRSSALKEVGTSIGKMAGLGAIGGATQPVTSSDFATTKAVQTGVGGAVGGVLGAASPVIAQIGRFLGKQLPENLAADAISIIKDRWNGDAKWGGVTADEGLKMIQEARARGQALTPADVGGPDLRSLAGRVARKPGDSRSMSQGFMEQRDTSAPERLKGAVSGLVSENSSAEATTDLLTAVQSAASKDAWDRLYQQKVGNLTDHFKQLLQNPRVSEGFKLGFQLERDLADAEGRPISHLMTGVDLDAQGNIKFVDMPNMRVLDMGKRGLDELIRRDRDSITGKVGAEGQSATLLKHAYMGELDKMTNGAYGRTMQVYSGPAASKDAVAFGRSVFGGQTSYEIEKEFNALSEGNKEFARVGVADAMMEKLRKGGIGSDEAKLLVKNEWVRDQLRPIFKSTQSFNEFMDTVADEIRMFETKRTLTGGSATAERVGEDTSPVGGLAKPAFDAARGNFAHAAVGVWRYLKGVHARNDPKLDSAIAQIVFGNPDALQAAQLTGQQAITKTNKALPASRVTNSIGQLVAEPVGMVTGGAIHEQ